MTDEVENAEDYAQSAFALVGRELPIKDGRVDIPLALNMCVHLASTGEIATLPQWMELRHPQPEFGWPEGTAYPADG